MNILEENKKQTQKTMTPKEKAEELVWLFHNSTDNQGFKDVRDIYAAERCALIAVDEILKLELNDGYDEEYWQEVKQEIEKL